MPGPGELREFYEAGYTAGAGDAARGEAWRRLGAEGKADHVVALLAELPRQGVDLLEVGCGDGALLAELGARRPAWALAGVEIAPAAVRLAAANTGADVREYDGKRLPFGDGAFRVGVLSHVLEHVDDPPALLRETARACATVVMEVPLEQNLSGRRGAHRAHSEEIGHTQSFSLASARAAIADAGLEVQADLTDPLPRAVHRFFASGAAGRLGGDVKWAVRAALHALSPALAGRLFTLHYAARCGRPAAG